MSRGSSSLIEAAVQVFYFSALFLGLALFIRPEFFQDVVIQFKPAPTLATMLAETTPSCPALNVSDVPSSHRHEIVYQDIVAKSNALNPYVAFIPTTDENNQRSELPLVFVSREEEYLKAKAIEFCLENYQLLTISDINALQTSCVDTVLNKVLAQVSDGKLFSFQEIVQRSIAQQQQQPEKVTPVERLNEGTSLGEKDIYKVAGTRSSYTVRLYTEAGKYHDITFDLQVTSPKKISEYFCSQKASELKVTTDNLFLTCIGVVEDYIVQKLKGINAVIPEASTTISSAATTAASTIREGN